MLAYVTRFVTVALGSLLYLGHLNATEPVANVNTASESGAYISMLQHQLGALSGFSFSSEIHSWDNPDYFPKATIDEESGRKGLVSMLVSLSQYRIDNKRGVNSGAAQFQYLEAYDGKTVQRLIFSSGLLTLQKQKEPFVPLTHRYTDAFLEPFVWLTDGPQQVQLTDPTLDQLKDPNAWNKLSAKILSVSQVDLDGKACIRIEFYYNITPDSKPDAVEVASREQTRFAVYLSKSDQCYPIGWDRYAKDGTLIAKYRITNLQALTAKGVSFYYPKTATRTLYGGATNGSSDAMGPHSDSPKMIITTQITAAALNPSPDDSEFTIDPSLATTILDIDQKTFIHVPR